MAANAILHGLSWPYCSLSFQSHTSFEELGRGAGLRNIMRGNLKAVGADKYIVCLFHGDVFDPESPDHVTVPGVEMIKCRGAC